MEMTEADKVYLKVLKQFSGLAFDAYWGAGVSCVLCHVFTNSDIALHHAPNCELRPLASSLDRFIRLTIPAAGATMT